MTFLADLEQRATSMIQQGEEAQAAQVCQKILMVEPNHISALDFLTTFSFAQNEFAACLPYLERLVALNPENTVFLTKLGYVQEAQGHLAEALKIYLKCHSINPGNPVIYLYIGYAYLGLGQEAKAAEVFSLGEDVDYLLLRTYHDPEKGVLLQHRARKGEQVLHQHLTNLHLQVIRERNTDHSLHRIEAAIWPQVDIRDFTYKKNNQRPHLFYIPDLLAKPSFARTELPWTKYIESRFNDIKQEVLNNLNVEEDGTPYLPANLALSEEGWDKIVGRMNWAAIHLYKQGVAADHIISKYPTLCEVLKELPLTKINDQPSEVFISVLKPETKIPPHFGVSNNTLTVHFPLYVPERCGLRVDNETFDQREGEIIAFDDSFDHEAWNNSQQPRLVLIFEVWHPDLTKDEQDAISATFDARVKWLAQRTIT